ncbi:MAG: bifunctional DNA primase/polymerase [Planctomycetaceae bacterium]|nr:bifunctional DNA primase/polymerase [Planctomycetaceae bacterium]
MSFKEIALQYIEAELCAFPAILSQKRPMGKWKEYQNRFPTAAEWENWQVADALCIVCGKISGNLLMIDFDQQGKALPDFRQKIAPELYRRLVIEQSQSGGFHIIVRSTEPVCGNIVLAKDTDKKVLIETRGEGGIFLCAPTPGYVLLQGDFNSIPVLSAAEIETLLNAAWSLDQCKQEEPPPPPPKSVPSNTVEHMHSGKTPMEDYNERGRDNFKRLLEKHGWRYTGEEADSERWLRPGKSPHSNEKSASLHHTLPTFYVHSSNCTLPNNKGYSLFYVYAHLEHGDDQKSAAKALAALGYGAPLSYEHTVLPDFLNQPLTPEQETEKKTEAISLSVPMPGKFDVFAVENHDELEQHDIEDPGLIPNDLLIPPGLVGEIATYCFETNPIPQQEFALATGIAMVAHLIGKNYRTPDNFRSNFYAMSIGESGAGKNKAIEFLLDPEIIAINEKVSESFTSPPAINNYLRLKGSLLMVWDELGGKMEEMLKKPNAIFSQVLYCLTALYSASGRAYFPDIKAADTRHNPIIQPHCCLYGTGTYESVFKTFEPKLIENGFIGRVNFFFADPSKKLRDMHTQPSIPESILETIKAWIKMPQAIPAQTDPIIPEAKVVPYTNEAEQIFSRLTNQCELSKETTPENLKRLWVRTVQEAKKLALIYACSQSMDNPSIDTEAAVWGGRLSEHLTRRKLYVAYYHMANSEQERLENDILRYIKKQPKQTVTQTKLINRFAKGVPDYVRDGAIRNLINTGRVVRHKEVMPGAKKPTTFYRIPH